jgi:glycine cleavage system H protein
MSKIPLDRLFTKEHEWVKLAQNKALVGITHYAQSSLGDVVYVELPSVGQKIEQGKAIGVVESVKAVSDIYAPISGIVKKVNQEVLNQPEKINLDPYNEGWLLEIEVEDQPQALLEAKDYEELLLEVAKC